MSAAVAAAAAAVAPRLISRTLIPTSSSTTTNNSFLLRLSSSSARAAPIRHLLSGRRTSAATAMWSSIPATLVEQFRRGFSAFVDASTSGLAGQQRCADEPKPDEPVEVEVFGTPWGYDEHNGPAHWPEVWPVANGRRQSPIDLQCGTSSFDGRLTETPVNWRYNRKDALQAKNDGKMLLVTFDGERSSLIGGPLQNEYKIENFHFHWGSDNSCGSEHLLEGKSFPAEVHVVHYNTMYGSFAEAVDKPNGLCVLGSFIQIGPAHVGMTPLFNHLLSHLKNRGNTLDMSAIGGADPATLLPDAAAASPDFYSYAGSLTQPPCHESVLWISFIDPITFSQEQMDALRGMSASTQHDHPRIVNNFRPVCPLAGRAVTRTFK